MLDLGIFPAAWEHYSRIFADDPTWPFLFAGESSRLSDLELFLR